ncbi:MAG: trypsin-like peptidase domain-containing protein [Erysipelotrichales bacterium]|nr:trypsin-like peptidase domain-containing protein [Erysipelotrichales bacterium]
MKKIRLCLLFGLVIFGLTACQTDKTANTIYNVDITEVQSQITNVIENVERSVFLVETFNATDLIGLGSGVVYNRIDGYYFLITNEHVIANGVRFQVFDGRRSFAAELMGFDVANDLAILRFRHPDDLNLIAIDTNQILRRGQFVLAIGSPLDHDYFNTVTLGIISGFRGNYIQHDAAINPGNSGGPLFGIDGKLIGINVAKIAWSSSGIPVEGIGFAINIETVARSISNMERNAQPITRPVLGVAVLSVSNYIGIYEHQGWPALPSFVQFGLVITDISSSSPADGSLEMFDVITHMAGNEIRNSDDLRGILWRYQVGDTVTITVIRNGVETEVNVTL